MTGSRRPGPGSAANTATSPRRDPTDRFAFYNLQEHEADIELDGGDDDDAGARELPGHGQHVAEDHRRRSARAAASTTSPTSASSRRTTRTSYSRHHRQRVISGSVTGTSAAEHQRQRSTAASTSTARRSRRCRGGTPRITSSARRGRCSARRSTSRSAARSSHLLAERQERTTATIDQRLSRFDIFPRLRFPFTKWQFLSHLDERGVTARRSGPSSGIRRPGCNLPEPISRHY